MGTQRTQRRIGAGSILLGFVCLVITSCGGGDSDTTTAIAGPGEAFETSFVGKIEGTNAFVAVAVKGEQVWAYACDGQGKDLDNEIASYLTGVAAGSQLSATDPDDGAQLTATLNGDAVSGEIALPDGTRGTFTAIKATGSAGWFAAQVGDANRSEVGSWIRLDDQQVRGKVLSLAVDASGTPVPSSATVLEGADLPPEAVPTGGLACYRATKNYYKILNDPNSTTSQINGANNIRRDKCGIFDQAT